MKHSRKKRAQRRYPRRQARPNNPGTLIARRLIVRALREAGLHHVLKGRMATIGFVFPPSVSVKWVHSAAMDLLNDLTPKRQTYHLLFGVGGGKGSAGKPHDTEERLVDSHLLFGFANDASLFPETFLAVADAILTLDKVDLRAIQIAFSSILGAEAPPSALEAAAKLPEGLLSAVIKRGRRLQDVLSILDRPHSPPPILIDAPELDTLSGYGAAAIWGQELVRDLAAYKRGELAWADVDRGALISGESGTGKTFFVRALASTCRVPMHVHSLARWQAQGHLGNLLHAMRQAFQKAVAAAPCILLLDEIDAIGSRDRFSGESAQYCSEVVNALLECLDGAEKRDGVVVVGTTNYPQRIDSALLRPGRLGRHLRIEHPNFEARIGILRHHLRGDLPEADLSDVANRLEGWTGAMIEQLVRDARRGARGCKRAMQASDLAAALPERPVLSKSAFERACVHEAGHGLVGYLLREKAGAAPVQIRVFREISESRSGAGDTSFHRVPGRDRSRVTYDASITTLLGGLAAEKVIFGNYSDTGGGSRESDLYLATVLAAGVVVSFGLDEGLAYYGSNDPEMLIERVRLDANLRRRVDAILRQCFDRAEAIAMQYKDRLEAIAACLEDDLELNEADIIELCSEG